MLGVAAASVAVLGTGVAARWVYVVHGGHSLPFSSRSLAAAERHVAMLGHQSAKERVASFFMALEMQRRNDDQQGRAELLREFEGQV